MTDLRTDTTRTQTIRPWQFGLRTLLVLMASASLLFLVMGMLGLVWSLVLVWLLVLVAGHVLGNTFGVRPRRHNAAGSSGELSFEAMPTNLPRPLAADPAAVRLRHKTIFRPLDFILIAAASVLAGGLGAAALWATYWDRFGYSAIVVGAISSAVIGGFLGFLCVSFTRVALLAVGDARRQSHSDRYVP